MAVWLEVERGVNGLVNFLRQCWRQMDLMKLSFERAELSDGTGPREGGNNHRRDEEAWLRMEDEGCPNGRPYPMRDKDIIVFATRTLSEWG
jgi:hypothetical protein